MIKSPRVSIIIRTKNEEDWIHHCLFAVFEQSYPHLEVIIVDNDSVDRTVEVASRFPIKTVVTVSEFFPGRAINSGVVESSGDLLVCLSAHCVPRDNNWLQNLVTSIQLEPSVAGAYGRQLPLSFTSPEDTRDLLIVFGQDRRIQEKDYFFHNANSIIWRKVWDEIPFDDNVTNIEDRVWGKAVIEAGYKLVYEPDAAVFHYHGLHQGNNPERARGVLSIIRQVDHALLDDLPSTMKPGCAHVAAIIPFKDQSEFSADRLMLLHRTVEELKSAHYVNTIFLLADSLPSSIEDVQLISRSEILDVDELGVDALLSRALEKIESRGTFPQRVLYVNPDYLNRPEGLFDKLITQSLYGGYESVFPGLIDYGHYWIESETGEYKEIDPSLKQRKYRRPIYRALYGLGTVVPSSLIAQGVLVGESVGVLELSEEACASRLPVLREDSSFSQADVWQD